MKKHGANPSVLLQQQQQQQRRPMRTRTKEQEEWRRSALAEIKKLQKKDQGDLYKQGLLKEFKKIYTSSMTHEEAMTRASKVEKVWKGTMEILDKVRNSK